MELQNLENYLLLWGYDVKEDLFYFCFRIQNYELNFFQASGAGKTTLLNVLNFRNRGDLKINGDVKINGQPINSQSALAAISGYVQQDELLIGTLTVKEHLTFQVRLRRK